MNNKKLQEYQALRQKTLQTLKAKNIDYCEGLPLIGGEKLCKNKEQTCKRFIASLGCSMLACDYHHDRECFNGHGREYITSFLEHFDAKGSLLPVEQKILSGECTDRDALNVGWTSECSHALLWSLGHLPDGQMEDASSQCNPFVLMQALRPFATFDDFKASCKMRTQGEVLRMLDLYYNYHWACVDHRLNPATSCGDLDGEVVVERRKALEWLVCKDEDWDDISLDT